MEYQSDPVTNVCEHCGQPPAEAEPLELEARGPSSDQRPPLYEVRTPGGRVIYVANLN
jgi:hypothetical protein